MSSCASASASTWSMASSSPLRVRRAAATSRSGGCCRKPNIRFGLWPHACRGFSRQRDPVSRVTGRKRQRGGSEGRMTERGRGRAA
eukprot:6209246-Prymnesium_polylepis.1